MAAIPFMPFYISDYLADTAHLETLDHGVYLLLIMNYWQTQKPLPNDDKKLAKIARLSLKKFQNVKQNIIEFFSVTETEWQHSRIEEELAIYRDRLEQARLAGKKSAEKRQQKKPTDVERPLNESSTTVEQALNNTQAQAQAHTQAEIKEKDNADAATARARENYPQAEPDLPTDPPPPQPFQSKNPLNVDENAVPSANDDWQRFFVNLHHYQLHQVKTPAAMQMFAEWMQEQVTYGDVLLAVEKVHSKLQAAPSSPTYYRGVVRDIVKQKREVASGKFERRQNDAKHSGHSKKTHYKSAAQRTEEYWDAVLSPDENDG